MENVKKHIEPFIIGTNSKEILIPIRNSVIELYDMAPANLPIYYNTDKEAWFVNLITDSSKRIYHKKLSDAVKRYNTIYSSEMDDYNDNEISEEMFMTVKSDDFVSLYIKPRMVISYANKVLILFFNKYEHMIEYKDSIIYNTNPNVSHLNIKIS